MERIHIIISCVNLLTEKQGIEWLLLVDGAGREGLLPGIPAHELLIRAALPGNMGWRVWYDWQIPRIVRKYRPDLLMTTGGLVAPDVGVPQCVWMPGKADPAAWVQKKSYRKIYRKRLVGNLREAGTIFSFSEEDKLFLEESLKKGRPAGGGSDGKRIVAGNVGKKIVVVEGGADARYAPLPLEEKETVKKEYAQGKEYFLTIAENARPGELVSLLKAFSGFKKRQQSNMQLVLIRMGAGRGIVFPDGRLDTYRYRQDVHVYDNFPEQEMPGLVAASYAFVAPFRGEGLGLPVLNAWKAGVPVITTVTGFPPGSAGDRVLYAQPDDPASLAGQLMLLYKDEGMRSALIGKALSQALPVGWEQAAIKVWNGIEAAVRDFPGSVIMP
ncbi:MAG TPA: glycosyltransferase [Puia sp.]|nr:glycosyltransferase [Puia sp.]